MENTFRAGEKVEVVRVESHSYNFLTQMAMTIILWIMKPMSKFHF